MHLPCGSIRKAGAEEREDRAYVFSKCLRTLWYSSAYFSSCHSSAVKKKITEELCTQYLIKNLQKLYLLFNL